MNYVKPQTQRIKTHFFGLNFLTLKQSIISFTGWRKLLTLQHKFTDEKTQFLRRTGHITQRSY